MEADFSVVMSVYYADEPEHFKLAVESILNQTLKPKELILVVDGPIHRKLKDVVFNYEKFSIVKIINLKENVGLGAARHEAIISTSSTVVAVMDSDDICKPERFEVQYKTLKEVNVDVVGSYIAEFKFHPDKIERFRKVPLLHEQILSRGRYFSPINHVTIMFQKESYLRSGGYRGLRKVEDYDLFHRMVLSGLKFRNIPEVLVYVRSSDDQHLRRHGLSYLREEIILHTEMMRSGYIGIMGFAWNILIRVLVRLMPVMILQGLSKRFLRNNIG